MTRNEPSGRKCEKHLVRSWVWSFFALYHLENACATARRKNKQTNRMAWWRYKRLQKTTAFSLLSPLLLQCWATGRKSASQEDSHPMLLCRDIGVAVLDSAKDLVGFGTRSKADLGQGLGRLGLLGWDAVAAVLVTATAVNLMFLSASGGETCDHRITDKRKGGELT